MNWSRVEDEWLINVHTRPTTLIDRAVDLMPSITDRNSRLWPSDCWPPLVLDNGLIPGSRGGHGPIRYRVSGSGPRHVRFIFDGPGPAGWHELRITDEAIEHELRVLRPNWLFRRQILPLHDALIEHLLDDFERLALDPDGEFPPRRWALSTRARYRVVSLLTRRRLRAARSDLTLAVHPPKVVTPEGDT